MGSSHRLVVDGQKFVFDVERVALFEVDDVTWDYLALHQDSAIDVPRNTLEQRYGRAMVDAVEDELRAAGLLAQGHDDGVDVEGCRGYTGLTLNVTHGCNMACTYCFASQGDYGLGKMKMSPETAMAAIDWFASRCLDGVSACVLFFGGEPMMNMPTICAAVDYAEQRLVDPVFQIVTNGTLLNEANVALLAERDIDVQVSLDGPPDVNDQSRIFPNGRSTYPQVVTGIQRLRARGKKVSVRATITHGNGAFFHAARHISDDLGATAVHFEPASASPYGSGVDAEDLRIINENWEKIADECVARFEHGEIWPISRFARLLGRLLKGHRSSYGCTAGQAAVAVDPAGDIYPCHRFVGDDAWRMGNVRDNGLDDGIVRSFAANSVDSRPACRTCWARHLCGGRCAHEALDATGSIVDPDPLRCEMIRTQCELALKLYARLEPLHRSLLEKLATRNVPGNVRIGVMTTTSTDAGCQ